ncbi:Dynamitin-domain-containing protein [Mycotypha africana]|uniref:Dynamitin-domain-containing protein n=1 Tax=Mycotypha africana TaxID=64632 RepID=UPI002301F95E|nr:Dynamitin-domain-containing protein [Mycotypha africana]KAI8991770.1 Dynamitin-domain-containing protein [Mycotypha africana]
MVTYELYYTPETVKMQKETKLSDIDQRLARLEKLIGSRSGEGLESLPSDIAASSLVNSLSKLEQQVAVLTQPGQLEMIARRVKILNSDLERLNELKSGRKDTYSFTLSSFTPSNNTQTNADNVNKDGSNDTETKINKMFDTMEKIDPLLNLTPALLTRLKSLQSLHMEAASFSQSVKVISEEQTRMADELKSLSNTCDLVKYSIPFSSLCVHATDLSIFNVFLILA